MQELNFLWSNIIDYSISCMSETMIDELAKSIHVHKFKRNLGFVCNVHPLLDKTHKAFALVADFEVLMDSLEGRILW